MAAYRNGVVAAMAGNPPPGFTTGGDDFMAWPQWSDADKQAMLDDFWRMLSRGEKIDKTKPSQVVDGSIGRVRDLVELVRVGDREGGDFDPHDYTSVEGAFQKAKQVEAKVDQLAADVAAQDAKLDQILAAVSGSGGGGTVPTFGGEHAH
jgi:hypothetical protein